MMATESEMQIEQPNQKVTVVPQPEEPLRESESEPQETPEFTEKDFPALASPNSESSKDTEHEHKFLDRINAIPMVAEGLTFVKGYVNDESKPFSKYAKYAYTTAGSAVTSASELVESRFPEQVNVADQLASKSLDYLEDQIPALFQKSSSEVYQDSRQVISQIVSTPTAAIDSTLVTVANNAEAVLDRFLPPASDEKDNPETSGLARLRDVGVDAQRRVVQVVKSQFDNISSVTTSDSMLHLRQTNVFFQRASIELASLNERLATVVNSTKDNITSVKNSSVEFIQQSQTQLTQRIRTEVDSVSKYIQDNAAQLPESVRSQIEPTLKFFNERVSLISAEFHRQDQTTLQKAKNAIVLATESVPYIDEARDYVTSFLTKKEAEVKQ